MKIALSPVDGRGLDCIICGACVHVDNVGNVKHFGEYPCPEWDSRPELKELYFDLASSLMEGKPGWCRLKKHDPVFTVWTVHRDNDDRSDGPITDVCGTRALAEAAAKGSGWYGGDAPVRTHHAIRVGNATYLLQSEDPVCVAFSLDDLVLAHEHATRLKALAKLTPEERRVLGL